MTVQSTLSTRGQVLANGPNIREKFKKIKSDAYDPETNPNGVINLGISENDAVIPDIAKYVNEKVNNFPNDCFSYGEGPWGTERLRKAMAGFIDRNFATIEPTNADGLIFANGVTSICEMLAFTIADPGDGVLLSKPIYQAFQTDFCIKAQMEPVFVDFDNVDQFGPEAAQKYENALLAATREGIAVKALVLCNPHNPLGKCYSKEAIIKLMQLCSKYRVHLLSDEIYAVSCYDIGDADAVDFHSVLSFDHTPYIGKEYCHVIYGLSKDFAAGGLRLGCIYLRNEELNRALSAITQFHWSGGPQQHIATLMLEDTEWLSAFQKRAREKLAHRNKLTRRLLDNAGVRYATGANAGFFLWIDLSPFLPSGSSFRTGWERERALSKQLLDNKVYLTEGEGLSAASPGFFRVIFSQDIQVLQLGLGRVFEAIGRPWAGVIG